MPKDVGRLSGTDLPSPCGCGTKGNCILNEEKGYREAYGVVDLRTLNPATHHCHFEIEALYWLLNGTILTNEGLQ